MPKCPKCKEEIDSLIVWSLQWIKQIASANSDFTDLDWSETRDYGGTAEEDYNCPECDYTITHGQEVAKELLCKR